MSSAAFDYSFEADAAWVRSDYWNLMHLGSCEPTLDVDSTTHERGWIQKAIL